MQPLVSILLPAFNAATTLPACLRSVQRQTERHWHCVIVDDGSTDATLDYVRQLCARDDRFEVIGSAHRGLVAALTAGLARCDGHYVARMDADDLMHHDRLAAQLAALTAAPHLVGVGCHVRLFPRAHLRDGMRAYEQWLNRIDSPQRVRENAFVESPIVHPSLLIRRAPLAAFGYRDQGWPEDYDLVLRLLGAGHEIGVVPRRLLSWRDSPTRRTRTHPAYRLERITACKAAFLAADFLAERERYVLWGYGETGRALCRALLEHGKQPSHVVEVHRGRLGNTIHGAPVITPEELSVLRGSRVVVSVAGEEPRRQIRAALHTMGFHELRDFVCAA
ncbi:MAG TPA: glycosyltransferase family A protein [Candidatus Kryptonia bacterium]|nr:glycosyltransferase family A protein [Candidatus Kryptonia bacterium]